jgi:hypothetical protein
MFPPLLLFSARFVAQSLLTVLLGFSFLLCEPLRSLRLCVVFSLSSLSTFDFQPLSNPSDTPLREKIHLSFNFIGFPSTYALLFPPSPARHSLQMPPTSVRDTVTFI